MSYCREICVPCLMYLMNGGNVYCLKYLRPGQEFWLLSKFMGMYCMSCASPTRLSLNPYKIIFRLTQCLKMLNMFCTSKNKFVLLEEKKRTFHFIDQLTDSILTSKTVFLKTLQRYSGKHCSLFLAMLTIFPGR